MKINHYALALIASIGMTVSATAAVVENPQGVRDMLNRIGGAGTADRIITIVDDSYGSTDNEKFQISARNGKPCIKGTTLSAVTTGIGWYLNHTANVNLAWNRLTDDLSGVDFPVPATTEEHSTTAKYRHYLNYCTFSYSMSTWTWERWQQEIDWMALHGINMPLHIVGMEEVWRKMLMEDYGYTQAEASDFVGGPCFMAWFGMNNLQGHGGPNPEWWYTRQAELGRKMTDRMHELGIEPVLPGFAGMVPSNFTQKTGIAANSQGNWCGFQRPFILTTGTEAFEQVAANYYKRLDEVMGKSAYYSMDPFHEGGSTGGVDTKIAYRSIFDAMDKAEPGALWFIQQWQWGSAQWNAVAKDVIPLGRLIVLDLYSDGKAGSQLNRYNGHETVFCMIPNFGARTGFFGRIATLVDTYFDKSRKIASVKGVAAVPEGIEQVPLLYDLLYEMAWLDTKPDAAKWVADYSQRRYGTPSTEAAEAWELLRTSALNCPTGLQGPHEAITCARPNLNADRVSTWGGAAIFYDTNSTYTAAYKLLNAGLSGENYSFDLVDISRQALTDYSKTLLGAIKDANSAGDTEAFNKRRDTFLQLILDLDELLNTNKDFMVGHWTERARAIADEVAGTTNADRDWLEHNNARTLITTWGAAYQANNGGLHDYSYRQWGGIMKDLYYERWKVWFDAGMKEPAGGWYNFEHNWATNSKRYPTAPVGSTAEVAARLLPKYLSPLKSHIAGIEPRYIQRLMTTDLKGKFFDSAKRGEAYTPDFNFAGTTISELAVDLNNNTIYDSGETSTTGSITIPADATIGEHTVRITLADGTLVSYTLRVIEEITVPRTVSVTTEDAAKGTVSIDGTDAMSVTGTDFYVVRANATASYDFDHWEDADGNNLGNANPFTYYGKADIALKAFFADNKWGIPQLDTSDLSAIQSNKQWIPSITLTQNGETAEIYSSPEMPESLFNVVPTRIKAAPGGEFSFGWAGADGLKYLFLSAYADFDNDGTFETLIGTVGTKGAQNAAVVKNSINVLLPFTAAKGTTHIRLRFDSAWNGEFDDATGAVPATAKTNRCIYDLLLDVSDSPTYPSTVTADVNAAALGTFRTENMANVYVPGEQVIITAFPNPGSRVASFTDNHGRTLPSEWISENSVRFTVYDNAHITVNFEKEPIDGWSFNWNFNTDGTAGITGVATPGQPSLDLSEAHAGISINAIDAATFAGRDDLAEITLPDAQLVGPGEVIHTAAHKGDGTQNKITNLTSAITGTTPWVMTIEGDTGGKNFNQYGSALYGNGTNALADNFSGGWSQYYLKANGQLSIKWDSGSETLFSANLHGKFRIVSEFDGNKTLTVTCVNAAGQSETKTITNSSTMQDISRYATAIPAGMDFTLTFRKPDSPADLTQLFAGCRSLTDIHVPSANTAYVEKDGVVYAKGGRNVIAYPEGRLNSRPFTPADAQGRLLHHDGKTTVFTATAANALHTLWTIDGNTLRHLNANAPAAETANLTYELVYGTGMPGLALKSGNKYLTSGADGSVQTTATKTALTFTEPLTAISRGVANGYTALALPVSVIVGADTKCYYVSGIDAAKGAMLAELQAGDVIPARTGFLLKTDAATETAFEIAPDATDAANDAANLLSGTTLDAAIDGYVLSGNDFVKAAAADANSAFISTSALNGLNLGDSFGIYEGQSGIGAIDATGADAATELYDLNGRRVAAGRTVPGIYISADGKKVIVGRK